MSGPVSCSLICIDQSLLQVLLEKKKNRDLFILLAFTDQSTFQSHTLQRTTKYMQYIDICFVLLTLYPRKEIRIHT